MPTPREQALSIGTEASKFREGAEHDAAEPPQPKEQDWRANPKNPSDGGNEPFKVTSQGG